MDRVKPPPVAARLPGLGCLLVIFLLLASSPALALDYGEGQLGSSYYSVRFQTFGSQFDISEWYGFGDFRQTLTNYGVLEGRLAYSYLHEPEGGSGASGGHEAYGRLSLKGYRWGQGVLDATAGDQAFPLSLMPVRFTNFFYPEQYFRGGSLLYTHPGFQVMVLGGEVTLSRGLMGETFRGLGEALYGFLARVQPWDRWHLESGLFLTHNEKDFSGTLVTRSNLVYRLASQYRAWSQLYLGGELLQSFSDEPASGEHRDVAYRVGGLWNGDRLRLEANYRDVGPHFHLINQIYQPDIAVRGYYLSGDYCPWPFLSMSGSYDSASNNLVTALPGRSISETEYRSGGVRFYRNPWPSVYWRYYDSNLATRSDFPVQVRGRAQGHYGEISQRFKFLEVYGRYEHFQFQDEITRGNSYRKDAPLLGIRGQHQKFSWYVEGEYDRFSPTRAGAGYVGPYLKVGGDYPVSDSLFLFGEVSYRTESRRYGGQFGVNWKLPRGFSLQAYGRLEKSTAGAGDFINNFSTNSVTVRLVKTFTWGRKAEVAGLKSGQDWLGSGSIEGWVFNDANLNQAKDAGEAGVPGIKVKLEDGSEVTTDARGYYKFPAVAAGKHVVTLEARRIPAAYSFEGSETVLVDVQRRGSARVDFPFVLGATIKGRLLEDHPRSTGKPASAAKGVADVLVILTPGNLNTYTDSEGYFSFEGILPRSYELTLAPDTLPENSRVTEPRLPLPVTLKPGDQVKELTLRLERRDRPIIFR